MTALTIKQAAASLGISGWSVNNAIRRGALPATVVSLPGTQFKYYTVEQDAVEEYRKSHLGNPGGSGGYGDPARISQAEAARLLGVCKQRMYQLRQSRDLGWDGASLSRQAVLDLHAARQEQNR